MHDESDSTHGTPSAHRYTCGRIVLLVFVIPFVVFGIIRLGEGNFEAGILLIVVGLSLLLIIPAGYIARLVFRGKLGELIRGEDIDHPVVSTKRFSFSLRGQKRPLWVTVLLYTLGWLVLILIFALAMR